MIIVLILALATTYARTSATIPLLTQIQHYASEHDEYPDPDNDDIDNPQYSSFQQSMKPSILTSWGKSLRIIKKQPFDPAQQLIDKFSGTSLANQSTEFARIISASNSACTQFFIWSDLHGAFHSLTRALTHLHHQGIIDNECIIKTQNTYLIFNGNALSGSPYILETLALICTLLHKNPQKAFYISGEDEATLYGEESELIRGLRLRSRTAISQPLIQNIQHFFRSLPYALIICPHNEQGIVYISPHKEFVQSNGCLENTILAQIKSGTLCQTSTSPKTCPRVRCIVTGTNSWQLNQPHTSATFSQKNDEPCIWSLTSSQTKKYRQKYRFFYDAYGLLLLRLDPEKSSLGSFIREVHMKGTDFILQECYNLYSGQPTDRTCELCT